MPMMDHQTDKSLTQRKKEKINDLLGGPEKNSFLDFWRVSGPFPGPGRPYEDRAHRGGHFALGPVSVA